jgi:hypothetical protein
MDETIITSVLGFDFGVNLVDKNDNPVKIGIGKTVYPDFYRQHVNIRQFDKKFFTSFNEELLQKIKDYKRLNS